MAMGNFREQISNVEIHSVLLRLSELGEAACKKEEVKAMHVYVYKGASSCGTVVWIITDVLHGDFLKADIDGFNDELSLVHTLRCDANGVLTTP